MNRFKQYRRIATHYDKCAEAYAGSVALAADRMRLYTARSPTWAGEPAMTCSRCREVNPEGKRFCGACGAPLARRCPACGGENPPGKKYCGDCGASLTEGSTTSAPPPSAVERVESAVPGLAERRQLTVMFCDLVGSTELAARLDPEDMREVIRAYQDLASRVVGRFDGHVARFLGDGLLIYFGYPRAHENDAERAILAGLDLVDAIAGIEAYPGRPLQARIGIATGLVVVGGLAEDRDSVVGETPNLAARLQTLAQPGTVVVAPHTYRLVAGLFEFADLGRRHLKGFAEPIRVWHALRESKAEGRFRARHGGAVAPRSDATRRWPFCPIAGGRPSAARVRWSSCRASPGSASPASLRRCTMRYAPDPGPAALLLLAIRHQLRAASGDRALLARGRHRPRSADRRQARQA